MKLRTKTALYYLLIVGCLLVVAGIAGNAGIRSVVREEVDEGLWRNWELVGPILKASPTPENLDLPNMEVAPLDSPPISEQHAFRDTLLYESEEDAVEGELGEFRLLEVLTSLQNRPYRIRLFAASVDSEDLEEAIWGTFATVGGLFLLSVLLFQFVVSARLWRPFSQILRGLEAFELNGETNPGLGESNTAEFRQLIQFLDKALRKMRTDYRSLKRFSENASHEIQTPLAIVQTKLERLLQSESLQKKDLQLIAEALEAVGRLSKLNKGLLLLAKIENNQFQGHQQLSLREAVKKELGLQQERIALKGLNVTTTWKDDCTVQSPPILLEILLGNLFANAIRHNVKGGKVHIEVDASGLRICNSGEQKSLDEQVIFDRFGKEQGKKDSAGLGLAISKEICNQQKWTLSYQFQKSLHCFALRPSF